jgi:glycosyltransferase involved in cell wall biosynthesis
MAGHEKTADRVKRVAIVAGIKAGAGGLGLQAATSIEALARDGVEINVLGRGYQNGWPLSPHGDSVKWSMAPDSPRSAWVKYTLLRWRTGRLNELRDMRLGKWAAAQAAFLAPQACYVFTLVGLETLRWAEQAGVPSVLDSPNGHIRNFREVCLREARDLCRGIYLGHPTERVVRRVEEEYQRATWIRVSSQWAKHSLIAGGVSGEKIYVYPQPLDLQRFSPPGDSQGSSDRRSAGGPLRICFVGSLDLRKGFVYLLRALRKLGPQLTQLRIVGATGDRWCRKLFAAEAESLNLRVEPGDPVPALQEAELFILPSLEDGFGFVVGEAMAAGLPVIVTDQCGAQEWVEPGATGWVVPARNVEALSDAIAEALRRRKDLPAMGLRARSAAERLGAASNLAGCGNDFYRRVDNLDPGLATEGASPG